MMRGFNGLSMGFAAGAVGGLICSLLIWLSGELGLTAHYGVKLKPILTMDWLYPRIVWGGLWGCAFIIPFFDRFPHPVRGLIFSSLPSAFQLFVVFPVFHHQGVMGSKLGELTWLFVLVFNAFWGVVAGLWLRYSR